MHYEAGVGHIGGNLSALDAILHLHAAVMTPRDVFVLSKGHSAGALYVALWATGDIDDDALGSFHKDGTTLAGHPVANWHKNIRFATGSLGHGLGLACGVALGKRLRGEDGMVYCLLSDGECQEGSIWESLIFARHQNLTNLVILVDENGLQGFGTTGDVASMQALAPRFEAFGFQVVSIDGHAMPELDAALAAAGETPLLILMKTVKGHGVSFMENRLEWHYLAMNEAQYLAALQEISDV